ncbi:MAG: protein kinase [bacterium]
MSPPLDLVDRSLADRYRVIEHIGSGTFGSVFRAEDQLDRARVVVKVLNGPYGYFHLDTFRREIDAARRLAHPSAVRILDYGVAEGDRPFLVMEEVAGAPLDVWASSRRPVSIAQAVSLVIPVAELLEEAHAAGIVHCDVKPSHILAHQVNGDPLQVKLIDFGIARLSRSILGDPMDDSNPASRRISGTPAYMSPERVLGADYDGRADVYSLAIVLYELLTGRLPFELPPDAGAHEVFAAQVRDYALPLRVFRADTTPTLGAFLQQALAKDPADRPTAAELAQYLRLERNLAARASGNGQSDREQTAATAESRAPTAVLARPGRRMGEVEVQSVLASLERSLRAGDLFGRFYERLMASSPDIVARFQRTNMREQKRILHHAMNLILAFFERDPVGTWAIERVRYTHSRAMLDIPPRLYAYWRTAFLDSVRELDSEIDAPTERAWRAVLQGAIDYIVAGYDG